MTDVIFGVPPKWLVGTTGNGVGDNLDMTATEDFNAVGSHRELRGSQTSRKRSRDNPGLDHINGNRTVDLLLRHGDGIEEVNLLERQMKLSGSDLENHNCFNNCRNDVTPTTSAAADGVEEKFSRAIRSRTLPTERALKSCQQRPTDFELVGSKAENQSRKLVRLDDSPQDAKWHGNDFTLPTTSCTALKSAVYALYRLEDFHMCKIGQGFFSEVYKVTHKTNGEVMVLKMNTIRSNRANVRREIELMANTFNHVNVVKFKGVCVDSGLLHALTEYCEIGSLDQLIKDERQQFHWPTRISLALDIARGMEYVSRTHIHRDLTSKNVLIRVDNSRIGDRTDRLTAVIADFGLAIKIPPKLGEDESPNRAKLPTAGTPYWMAPECLNEEFYDEKSDVFSFGIILCEIIARVDADPDTLPRTPNFGLDYNRFWELVPMEVPEDFLKLAFQCCRMNPDSRPTFDDSVALLAELLETIWSENYSEMTVGPTRFPLRKSHSDAGPIHNGSLTIRNTIQLLKLVTSSTIASPLQNGSSTVFLSRRLGAGDPSYQPGEEFCNPFKQHANYRDGKKIFSQIDINGTAPNASSSHSFISNPANDDRRTRSLPTSPLVAHRVSACLIQSQLPSPIQEMPTSAFDSNGSLSLFDKSTGDISSVRKDSSGAQLALTDANLLGVKTACWSNSNSPRSKSPAAGRKLTAEFIQSDFDFLQRRKNRCSLDDCFDDSIDDHSDQSSTEAEETPRLGVKVDGVLSDLSVIRSILEETTKPTGAAELISPAVDLTLSTENNPASLDMVSPMESIVTLTSRLDDGKVDTIVMPNPTPAVSKTKYCGDRMRDRCAIL